MTIENAPDSGILRLAYLPPSGFIQPIVTRLNASKSPVLRTLLGEWETSGIADLAISVSTKVAMLSLLAGRLFGSLSPLTNAVREANLPAHLRSGKGLVIGDRNAPYVALLEFDAFIYEFRSTYEILGKLEKTLAGSARADRDDVCSGGSNQLRWFAS